MRPSNSVPPRSGPLWPLTESNNTSQSHGLATLLVGGRRQTASVIAGICITIASGHRDMELINNENISIARLKISQVRSWLKQILFQFLSKWQQWLRVESQIDRKIVPNYCSSDCEVPSAKCCSCLVPVTAARQPDTADRRCRRLAIEVTGTQSAARYGGASPYRHLS